MTKLQLPKLHTTVVNTFLIINISNKQQYYTTTTSFELASSKARITSVKSTKQQSVSESLTRVANDRTWVQKDKGNCKYWIGQLTQTSDRNPILNMIHL